MMMRTMNVNRGLSRGGLVGGGAGKERMLGVKMIEVHFMYLYEERIVKPTKYSLTKGD
jgi:hypothetical protein